MCLEQFTCSGLWITLICSRVFYMHARCKNCIKRICVESAFRLHIMFESRPEHCNIAKPIYSKCASSVQRKSRLARIAARMSMTRPVTGSTVRSQRERDAGGRARRAVARRTASRSGPAQCGPSISPCTSNMRDCEFQCSRRV